MLRSGHVVQAFLVQGGLAMFLLNDTVIGVQLGFTCGMAVSKFLGLLDWGWHVVLAPFWVPWSVWLTIGVLYFPYWYLYRRDEQ